MHLTRNNAFCPLSEDNLLLRTSNHNLRAKIKVKRSSPNKIRQHKKPRKTKQSKKKQNRTIPKRKKQKITVKRKKLSNNSSRHIEK